MVVELLPQSLQDLHPLLHFDGANAAIPQLSTVLPWPACDCLATAFPIEIELRRLKAETQRLFGLVHPRGRIGGLGRASVVINEQLVPEFAAQQYVSGHLQNLARKIS